jgi:hypothetical protein
MHFRLLAALVTGVFLQACATAPTSPPATRVASAAPVSPAAPAMAAAPAAPGTAAAAGADVSADEHIKFLAKRAHELEYKIHLENGERTYCRKEAALGTRFVTMTCLTEPGFEDKLRDIELTQATMRQSGACNTPGCQHN